MKTSRTALMFAFSALLAGKLLAPTPANAATPDDDKQFLSMAAQSDTNEIKLSELAETKASSPQVKAFARKMVADHNKLEMQMKPFATKWNVVPPTGPDAGKFLQSSIQPSVSTAPATSAPGADK